MRPLIVILGPTAGGKTALSIAIAQRLPGGGEIIGADSMQVYRGMDIGTAKPTAEEQTQAPHHLFDVVDPTEPFTADDWRKLAHEAIDDIRSRDCWPIVVGGTNLYAKILLEGMFEGPAADPAFREEMANLSLDELAQRLSKVDPEATTRIHRNDRRRMTRALEVHHQTGRPISEWQQQWDRDAWRDDTIVVGLDWTPESVNRRINARVRLMVEAGLIEEVRTLWEAGRLGPQAREALGYKQVIAHFEGELTEEEAIERVKIETRRFARKQRTWLKRFRQHPRGRWLDADNMTPQDISEQSLTFCLKIH